MPGRTTPQPFKLALRARPNAPLQRHADFDLLLNGKVVGEVYYNLTGYVGTLPQPDGPGLALGERGISAYRAEVARINREARNGSTRSGHLFAVMPVGFKRVRLATPKSRTELALHLTALGLERTPGWVELFEQDAD